MRIAAIDIGSNAIRFRVAEVFEHPEGPVFKNIENVRFPLRLGKDVFNFFKITPPTEEKLLKLMQAYRSLLELYDVRHYLAFATSALREAANGKEIIRKIASVCHMQVSIITGEQEASLISRVVMEHIGDGCYLHVDVGGGSTELNFYQDGQPLAFSSFRVGAVRPLKPKELGKVDVQMQDWLAPLVQKCAEPVVAVGTGGNINALLQYSQVVAAQSLTRAQLAETRERLAAMTIEERVNKLNMAEDRADVIVPGADIYLKVMQLAGALVMKVPGIGLVDGIIRMAWQQYTSRMG